MARILNLLTTLSRQKLYQKSFGMNLRQTNHVLRVLSRWPKDVTKTTLPDDNRDAADVQRSRRRRCREPGINTI